MNCEDCEFFVKEPIKDMEREIEGSGYCTHKTAVELMGGKYKFIIQRLVPVEGCGFLLGITAEDILFKIFTK